MRPPFAPAHAAPLIRAADAFLRRGSHFSVHDPASLIGCAPAVFVCRHGQLWAALWSVRGIRLRVLVSRSPDGELLARLLEGWGFRVTRGSTSSAGLSGARGALRALRGGDPVGIAVDGPRGPRGEVQEGPIRLARRAAVPLVPLRVHGPGRWILRRTWDHFEIPRPLQELEVEVGPAVRVGPGEGGIAAARREIAAALADRNSAATAKVQRSVDPVGGP